MSAAVEDAQSVGGASAKSAKSKPGITTQLTRRGFVVAGAGPLPVSGRHDDLRVLAAAMSAPSRCVVAPSCSGPTSQQQRAAGVVEPQLGAAHRVPCRLLAGHEQEQDRRPRAAGPGVVRRQRGLGHRQLAAPGLPEPAALGMWGQVEPARPVRKFAHRVPPSVSTPHVETGLITHTDSLSHGSPAPRLAGRAVRGGPGGQCLAAVADRADGARANAIGGRRRHACRCRRPASGSAS